MNKWTNKPKLGWNWVDITGLGDLFVYRIFTNKNHVICIEVCGFVTTIDSFLRESPQAKFMYIEPPKIQ